MSLVLIFIIFVTGCNTSNESAKDKALVEDSIRELKSNLFNPEKLQVHDVIIEKSVSEDDDMSLERHLS